MISCIKVIQDWCIWRLALIHPLLQSIWCIWLTNLLFFNNVSIFITRDEMGFHVDHDTRVILILFHLTHVAESCNILEAGSSVHGCNVTTVMVHKCLQMPMCTGICGVQNSQIYQSEVCIQYLLVPGTVHCCMYVMYNIDPTYSICRACESSPVLCGSFTPSPSIKISTLRRYR